MNIKDCIKQVYLTLVSNVSPDDEVEAVANFEAIQKELERLWKIEAQLAIAIKSLQSISHCIASTCDGYSQEALKAQYALKEIKALGESVE